ncbi:hypothetical protein [Nocardioides marmoribigeumensis]|uniref:Barstar (barnase inhibitor) domain-containing protein n=1 Tax=Nocardioides marmoribigeumensis TaxID=433649 RepID=A0ABU2BRP9_9ACTN|nr:hypothetical protein [Nocardioides marmoribigeumensis]MDR7361305.1 hypothetical protein [Nocardioides marmoribigeumensis]
MSGLAALLAGHTPPDVYQWHNAAHVEDVQHAVEHAGWTFRHLDGWTLEDRDAFTKALCAAVESPDADSLDQISLESGGGNGTVLLWDGWSPLARHDEPCFQEALGILSRRTQGEGGAFAVVLRGEGPPLDLEELPVKH